MKIAFISDLHSRVKKIEPVEADVLFVAGDLTMSGRADSLRKVTRKLASWPVSVTVLIAGNHDGVMDPSLCLEDPSEGKDALYQGWEEGGPQGKMVYLEDSWVNINTIDPTLESLTVYGTPWTQALYTENWAFSMYPNKGPEYDRQAVSHWAKIPDSIDVLLAHSPGFGWGDLVDRPRIGESPNVGCPHLINRVGQVNPKIFCHGHIHEGYGREKLGGTWFVNASTCTVKYAPLNPPFFFEWENGECRPL